MTGRATARLAPGDLVVGRHRLLREVARGPGSALWQAEDEVLARPVAVRVLTDTAPDALDEETAPLDGPFLAAALRAGRLSDHRVASVYDAGEEDGVPLVVREWVDGEPLSRLLLAGPLPPQQVARIGVEVAAALTAAHARGVGHGALHPGDVVLTRDGVKLTDLEVAAALEGHPVPTDPAARGALDARSLGDVLYAASTGCWPSGGAHGLPAAPQIEGRVCTPHQVRAAVPRSLDGVITAAMDGRYPTPGAVAVDLAPMSAGVSLRPVPEHAPPATQHSGDRGNGAGHDGGEVAAVPAPAAWRRAALLLLVLALVASAAWTMGLATGRLRAPRPDPPDAAPLADGGELLRPVAVEDFDPAPGDGEEKPTEVRLATDGNTDTAWRTDTYRGRPELGGLKPGVGVLLDLGEPAALTGVELRLAASGGALQVRGGLDRPETSDDLPLLAAVEDPGHDVDVAVATPDRVRYVLLWFTRLPPRGSGFGSGIGEVALTGLR